MIENEFTCNVGFSLNWLLKVSVYILEKIHKLIITLAKQTNPSEISSIKGLHFSIILFLESFDEDVQIVLD